MNTYKAIAKAVIGNRSFCWVGKPAEQYHSMKLVEMLVYDLAGPRRSLFKDQLAGE